MKTSLEMTWYITKTLCGFVIHLPGNIIFFATHSKERREKIAGMKETIKKEVDHYWVGIKVSFNRSHAVCLLKSAPVLVDAIGTIVSSIVV